LQSAELDQNDKNFQFEWELPRD